MKSSAPGAYRRDAGRPQGPINSPVQPRQHRHMGSQNAPGQIVAPLCRSRDHVFAASRLQDGVKRRGDDRHEPFQTRSRCCAPVGCDNCLRQLGHTKQRRLRSLSMLIASRSVTAQCGLSAGDLRENVVVDFDSLYELPSGTVGPDWASTDPSDVSLRAMQQDTEAGGIRSYSAPARRLRHVPQPWDNFHR